MLKRLLYNGRSKVMFDIDRLHQAYTARTINEMVFLAKGFKLAAAVRAHLSGILQQVLSKDGFNRCNSSGTGNGVTTKGRAVVACDKQVGSLPGQHCPDRYATCQAFGHGHDIGYDTIVFPAKELASAAHAGLHLVADHHQVTLVTPCAHALYKLRGTGPDAALALYGLEQHAHRFLARGLLQSFQIVVWYLFETIRKRYPRGLVESLPGGSGCCQCAPVEAALHTDNFIGSIFMDASKFSRELDRSFVCLRTAIREE